MRKIAILSVVIMVLPHELNLWRLMKSDFFIRLKLIRSHLWDMVHTEISASGFLFIGAVTFLTCWQMVKGASAWQLPCGKGTTSLSRANREVPQMLDWSRGARVKGAGARSAILINETCGHPAGFRNLKKSHFTLMTDQTFCCCTSWDFPIFALQSESWACCDHVQKAHCDAALLMGTFLLHLLDLWLMLFKADSRGQLVVQKWEIIFCDWSERKGRSKCNCVGSAVYYLQYETTIRRLFWNTGFLSKSGELSSWCQLRL